MPIRHQPGFFDINERTTKLTEMGDPLVALKRLIDWEAFRPCLTNQERAMREPSRLMWF
jgi:hypothetical protein